MKKFLLGMLSILLLIPITESLAELICQWIEVLKIKSTKEILKGNNEIADLQSQLEEVQTQAIGFEIPSDDYYEDEWEEEEELKNKIGFV